MNNQSVLSNIAEKTGLTQDSLGESRLFADDLRIDVHAPTMGKELYEQMEKDIDKAHIKRDYYEVYCWNDCSGFDYWNEEGGHGGTNYIQIEVNIIKPNPCLFLTDMIKSDVEKVYDMVCTYHNTEYVNWGDYLG